MSNAPASDVTSDLDELGFAVYGLQGGGLGRFVNGLLVFHELPEWCPDQGFNPKVGHPVPEEWGYEAANAAARTEVSLEEFPHDRIQPGVLCGCGDANCTEWPDCVRD